MLSLRTALFRSRSLNALTRQTVRVPHLAHKQSSHKPPTTIMGRAFSGAPKLLKSPAEIYYDLDLGYDLSRGILLYLAGILEEQKDRNVLEAVNKMSDRELRKMVENHVEYVEDYEKVKTLDDKKLRSDIEKAFKVWASIMPQLEVYRTGEEYDAQMARMERESNLTESGIDKAIDKEGKKVKTENKDK